MREKIFANALNHILEFGPKRLILLKNHFGNFENCWRSSYEEIKRAAEIKEFNDIRKVLDPEKEWQILEKEKIQVVMPNDREYPAKLLETPYPPAVLYLKGEMPEQTKPFFAVVGTRNASTYGKESCQKIVKELAKAGFVIISGLASGIDGLSHKIAIENKTKTIAVLGSGLWEKVLFPAENKKLARSIAEGNGALISEYPFRMAATRFTFPQRNRIVAGMTSGTLVIEAPEKSGALITAYLALDYNRDVFSVPGPIFSKNSVGANNLIKAGAKAVTEAEDILKEYGFEIPSLEKNISLSEKEKIVLEALSEPMPVDEIIARTALKTEEINSILSLLEIYGLIKNIKGEVYKIH